MAAKATVHLASVDGLRSLPVDSSFFTGYKQTAVKPNEVLVTIEIPFTMEVSECMGVEKRILFFLQNEFFTSYKQSRRREDDIAIVNAGFRVVLEPQHTVKEIALCYGGMSYKTLSAPKTEESLVGR